MINTLILKRKKDEKQHVDILNLLDWAGSNHRDRLDVLGEI